MTKTTQTKILLGQVTLAGSCVFKSYYRSMDTEARSRLLESAAHLLTAAAHLMVVPGNDFNAIPNLIEESKALIAKAQE
jgi:hypothetical protein